ADLVIESLELQMRTDPVYSVSICCQVGALAEVLDISRNLFSNFRVRAVLHRNPVAWDLEVVQSDGLAYAAIQSQQPPGGTSVTSSSSQRLLRRRSGRACCGDEGCNAPQARDDGLN
ncbi:unnamed protein product, partial [Symbiodinium sp. CCMP2456]